MNLKPQDVLVVLKLVSHGSAPYGLLAIELGMSPSEVHAAMKRAAGAGLVDIADPEKKRVHYRALYGFLVHGVPRSFAVKPGPIVRGLPTAHAAAPLSKVIANRDDLPPVWPDPDGKTRGYELKPSDPTNGVGRAICSRRWVCSTIPGGRGLRARDPSDFGCGCCGGSAHALGVLRA